ncbi:hypothetical protein L6258_03675 [Candidatus Parcubacteria bacterium]|nr:hypothetical protein [Candidatus Parcubacteria bacterium]
MAGTVVLDKSVFSEERYGYHGPLPPTQNVPQPIGPSGGVEIENRNPARLSWIDCFEYYDVQLDVAPWHNNACWPREWWSTTFNVTGSSMDLYDFEDPERLAFLSDGEYWWRIRGYRGDNPSDWSDWQHFLLVNCSPPFTFSPRLQTARVAGEILSQSYFCPSNPEATPTLEPTPVLPTETPRPAPTPTATTIPFTKPQLVSPADGTEFTSGDQIVLTWSCPGGRAWSKVVVEREGVTHDSGWTKEFSWESPFNNYGEVKWKAIAKKGDEELSEWSDEWTYRIQGGDGIPPRLIDPTKGTVIQCGNDVLFHWECRSYECQIKTWHPDYDTHYTGWTKWTWWRVEAIHVHPGTNYWSGQGRDEAGNETSWTEAWIFTIQGCTPTPAPTPVPTATATRTNTPWPTVTPMPTNTPVPTATATETLVPSSTPVPTNTQLPTATSTATLTSTPVPTATLVPTNTPVPTNTVRPTVTATRIPTSTPVPTDTAVPTATAPSSGTGPTLSRPPPGSVFQSGAHIVLKWNPGPWDQYYCFVEREGQYYNSGWTTNTSWVSPVNDYGGVVWKVKARQGGVETSWSEEWHFDIEGGSGVPPRLIDPTKGAIFQCGNDVFFQWECRSYECLIETWHPAFDAHNTGWTKWHQWLIPPSAVHGGVNYWHGKGRDEQGRETSWTEAWTFTIQGCTPTPPIP